MILYNCTDSRVDARHKDRQLNRCCSGTADCCDNCQSIDLFIRQNGNFACSVIFLCSCVHASDLCKCANDCLCGTADDDHFERTADCCCSGTFRSDCKTVELGNCCSSKFYLIASDICCIIDSRIGLIIKIDHNTGRCNCCCSGTGC